MENHLMRNTHFKVFQKIPTDKVNRVLVLHIHIYSLQDQFVVQICGPEFTFEKPLTVKVRSHIPGKAAKLWCVAGE